MPLCVVRVFCHVPQYKALVIWNIHCTTASHWQKYTAATTYAHTPACMHARTHTVNKYRVQWHTHAHLLGTKCLISFFSGTSQVMTCWRPGVTKLSHALTHRHTICPGRDGSRWRARSVLKFWLGIYNLQEKGAVASKSYENAQNRNKN